MNPQTEKIKLIVVGDGNTGKSTMVKRIKTENFEKYYKPTIGVEVHSLNQRNSTLDFLGKKEIVVWDCAGVEKFGGLRDGYYIQANCAIVTFCDQSSANSVQKWINDIERVCGKIPIIVCRTKNDIIAKSAININLSEKRQIINCSYKTCENWYHPFKLIVADCEALKQK